MFSSLRHSTASKTAIPPSVAPRIPSAFNARVNQFGPPPTRHVAPAAESPSSDPVSPAREEPRKINRTEDGEWAEAVYDYSSEVSRQRELAVCVRLKRWGLQDAGDLQLREHQRVLVVEKTSEDWCVRLSWGFVCCAETCEQVDGRERGAAGSVSCVVCESAVGDAVPVLISYGTYSIVCGL